MPTLGIIGGIGPEATIDYYRLLLAEYRAQRPDAGAPSIVITSIDVRRLLALAASDTAGLLDYLLVEVERLARAGADFAIMAATTPHVVYDGLSARACIPMLSIVTATTAAIRATDVRRVALFGTRMTMEGRFYADSLIASGITAVALTPDERTAVHDAYVNELVSGIFRPETRARFVDIAERLHQHEHISGLILAGTELPMLLRDVTVPGVTLFDSTTLHVRRIVQDM